MTMRRRTIIRLGGFFIRLRLRCACLARWRRRLGWGWERRLGRRDWRRLCGAGDLRTSAKLRRRRSIWCLRRGSRTGDGNGVVARVSSAIPPIAKCAMDGAPARLGREQQIPFGDDNQKGNSRKTTAVTLWIGGGFQPL